MSEHYRTGRVFTDKRRTRDPYVNPALAQAKRAHLICRVAFGFALLGFALSIYNLVT